MGSVPVFLALLLVVSVAAAQEPKYRLVVEAPERELRDMLDRGLQLGRWRNDPQMTPELLRRLVDEALAEAREALAARGYFAAQVSPSVDFERTPWTVTLKVVPGARTVVKSVDIAFTGPGADDPEAAHLLRRVRADWLLKPGMPFTQEDWNEAKREAVSRLASWRYAAASIASSRARVDPQAHTAALEIVLDSGVPYRFGSVEVQGAKRYPAALAANLSPVRPGETYDRDVLTLYTQRLLANRYYSGARAELVPEGPPDAAPVRVSVIEGNSKQFEGGLSYNTDAGPRLELSHSDADLFDRAWRGRAKLRVDHLTQEARYDLDLPPRPGGRWWSAFGGARKSVIQNEESSEVAAGVAHNWAGAGSPTALIASAHDERQHISGEATDYRHAVYFGMRVGFRETDEVLQPRRGVFGQLNAGGAPQAVSSQGFLRGTARGTVLWPLGRNDDLQVRGEAGVVLAPSREGIPSTFLFRTGGDQTVRGYAFESLGVRRGDAVLGARRLAIGSVELTHWFAPSWGLAVFADGGNAWDEGHFDPVYGLGGGARFRTPIGPVRVDLAYGVEEDSWRLHFSVGFVF